MISISYFNKGLKENFLLLEIKNPDSLYFCTDTKEIFVGSDCYTEPVRVFTGSLPASYATGVLYINADTGGAYRYNELLSDWDVVIKPIATSIAGNMDDTTVPSSKAVVEAISTAVEAITGGSTIIADINFKEDEDGVLVISKSDGNNEELEFTGFVHNPTYNSTELVLTIPIVGENDLVINLPKDNFVESGVYNTETGNIELTMKNGGVVYIPASDFVDIYKSGSGVNDTISVVVSADNKISATFKVDTTGILSIAADGKLTIDMSDYATITSVENLIGNIGEKNVVTYIADAISSVVSEINTTTNNLNIRIEAVENSVTWKTF